MEKNLREIKEKFEEDLTKSVEELKAPPLLSEALHYAFDGGAKRVRPLIVFCVAEALKNDLEVTKAALSTEYFHTASLIADDMPCMDNDSYRRDRYTLHKAYGETIALLTSYGMITEGFRKIYEAIEDLKKAKKPFSLNAEKVGFLALECATRCSGYLGAVSGQFFDLAPPKRDFETAKTIIDLKTTTLFEAAFFFGWIFGGGSLEKTDKVKELSHHFGLAFQIGDDIKDFEQDRQKKGSLNSAVLLGIEKATSLFQGEMAQFYEKSESLGILSKKIQQIGELLEKSVPLLTC